MLHKLVTKIEPVVAMAIIKEDLLLRIKESQK